MGFEHEYRVIDDEDLVMSKLLFQNKFHLNKAWETPCVQGPLKNYIGEYMLGKGAQDALGGNFDPNKSENLPTVNFWLKHNIQRVAAANSINVEISLDNYKLLKKAQNKSTSLSPLGRHYGHYRAILDHDDICLVHTQMMSLPYIAGFTPSRWEKAIE
eukprot:8369533-Ditylum_brightwellii.AAC.1